MTKKTNHKKGPAHEKLYTIEHKRARTIFEMKQSEKKYRNRKRDKTK